MLLIFQIHFICLMLWWTAPDTPMVTRRTGIQLILPPVSMTFQLKDTVKLLPSASTQDLKSILAVVERLLEYRRLNDLLDYYPGVIDTTLAKEVLNECESLNLPDSRRKPESQWLSMVD